MQLTKEMAQKQLETIKANTEGFIQGYVQALSFAIQVAETKETEKPVEQVQP